MEFTEEHIAQLLSFVEDVYKRVPDFAKGVRKIVNGESSTEVKSQKLDKIEKYLSLDYGIDDVVNPDYSFIKDSQIRDTLNSDYREMLRFRYGTREHSVNFGEFARYANLQMEMLVNYYYTSVYGTDQATLLQLLRSWADDHKPDFINLNAKINGLKHEFNWTYNDIHVYLNIIDVRNEESHRSPGSLATEITKLEKEIASLKKKKSSQDSDTIKKKEKAIRKLQSFKKWLDPLPYEEVSTAIKSLSDKVKEHLLF